MNIAVHGFNTQLHKEFMYIVADEENNLNNKTYECDCLLYVHIHSIIL